MDEWVIQYCLISFMWLAAYLGTDTSKKSISARFTIEISAYTGIDLAIALGSNHPQDRLGALIRVLPPLFGSSPYGC